MAKQSGLGWTTLSVDDSGGTPQVIKNDITNLQFSTPRGVQDVTGIDKSAIERLLLLADFSVTLNGVFNVAANTSHDVFKTVPSTSVARTTTLTICVKTLAREVLFTNCPLTRAHSAKLSFALSGGLTAAT